MPSEIIDELPVTAAAMNLDTAMIISTAKETYRNDFDFIYLPSIKVYHFITAFKLLGLYTTLKYATCSHTTNEPMN